MGIFVVKPRNCEAKARLIKADRRGQVESFVLKDFSIEKADAEEAAKLGADGVRIEDVGAA